MRMQGGFCFIHARSSPTTTECWIVDLDSGFDIAPALFRIAHDAPGWTGWVDIEQWPGPKAPIGSFSWRWCDIDCQDTE